MPLVFAAIAPHGDLAIPEACAPEQRDLAAGMQAGMRELERRAKAARPDLVIVLTPHNIHVTGAMAVIVSSRIAGNLPEAPEPVALDCQVDRPFAGSVLEALRSAPIPAVGVSYGGNAAEEAVMPMDWDRLVMDAIETNELDRLLSYEAPTYYGMLCASFAPANRKNEA